MEARIADLKAKNKTLEAYRLEQKVTYDMEMITNLGFTNGIENYSRYFDGRKVGDPPFTLLDYFSNNAKEFKTDGFLTFIDESHITIPQVRGMYNGDRARKETLVEYGFRLPSALDNRPLRFEEFLARNQQLIYVSATPTPWEISQSGGEIVEQVIRPTGLIDPEIEIRPVAHQIEDLITEVIIRKQKGQRTLVTTLTKKMAEALTDYLNDQSKVLKLLQQRSAQLHQEAIDPKSVIYPSVAYLHSDVETLERSDILDDLRRGTYDVLVGINLLREGLDLPEVTLVAILDADKEGFLRSTSALIQTMGRAARHVEGHVILYADVMTKSMTAAIAETKRRRDKQLEYNAEHGIMPLTIQKPIRERMIEKKDDDTMESGRRLGKKRKDKSTFSIGTRSWKDISEIDPIDLTPDDTKRVIQELKKRMRRAADELNFEEAAEIRDVVKKFG